MSAASAALLCAAEGAWEKFAGGSAGQVTSFPGAGGVTIAAYVRKPGGPGPFPLIINLHGGGPSVDSTYGYGRSQGGLVARYLAAGWAVYSMDLRGEPRGAPTRRLISIRCR